MLTKVLFILPTLHAGGTENYVLRFVNFCEKKKYEWHILSVNLNHGDLHQSFEELGCKIYYQSIGYLNLKKITKFYQLLKREGFDAICTFNGNFGGLYLAVARLAGIKKRIAWHRRSSDAFGKNGLKKLYNAVVNRLIRISSTMILSNSRHALETFYGAYYLNDKRFKIIPNGINPKEIQTELTKLEARQKLGLPKDIFLIGHVGRFDKAKNHQTIFKIALLLKKKYSHLRILFCGKDTDSNTFINQLKYYHIEDMCYNLGLSDKLKEVYKAMDVFYFPSITEGQPNALIEAMISGLPVIASNIPPILEMLPHHLHQYTNHPMEKAAVIKLIEDLQYKSISPLALSAQNWAEREFDQGKNFTAFFEILTA